MANPIEKAVQAELKINEDWRRMFKIPKPECVVQVYQTGGMMSKGTLYLSQHYACYSCGKACDKVAFSDVATHGIGPKGGLNIKLNNGTTYCWLDVPKAAYTMFVYLMENPANYIDLNAIKEFEQRLAQESAKQNQPAQSQMVLPQIDLALADSLLSLALDTDLQQNSLMDTVARQGEQIDRIGNTLDTIDGKLARADHLLRGIESYRYYMFGGKKKSKAREEALEKRTMNRPANVPPPIEVECLFKAGDNLVPAIVSLEQDGFQVLDPSNNKPFCGAKFVTIDALIMTVKPEHMHIMIKGAKGPIVVISSYLQVITNQIFSRAKKLNAQVKVIFNMPARKFEYQDDRVSAVAAASGVSMADLLSDPQAKKDANALDSILDQTRVLTQGIVNKGQQMNVELDRQNQALGTYNNRVDGMIQQSRGINNRLDHQNNKF